MRVLMMRIGEMRMFMPQGCVLVPMGMRFAVRDQQIIPIMFMLMVAVVRMGVFMFQRIMLVCVGMVFRQVQPQTKRHQQTHHQQRQRDRFPQ
jgi:hypothetical protein